MEGDKRRERERQEGEKIELGGGGGYCVRQRLYSIENIFCLNNTCGICTLLRTLRL